MKRQLGVLDLPADRMEGEVVAALFFEDERPLRGPAALLDWRLDGRLTRMLQDGELTGRAGESAVIVGGSKVEADWVLFYGGGRLAGLGQEAWRNRIGSLLEATKKAGFCRIALCLAPLAGLKSEEVVQAVHAEVHRLVEGGVECLLSVDDSGQRKSSQDESA